MSTAKISLTKATHIKERKNKKLNFIKDETKHKIISKLNTSHNKA